MTATKTSALNKALLDADDAGAIVEALARVVYREGLRKQGVPPADWADARVPSVDEFLSFWSEEGFKDNPDAFGDYNARIAVCVRALGLDAWEKMGEGLNGEVANLPEGERLAFHVVTFHHRVWCAAKQATPDGRVGHPLAGFMRAWQAQPRAATPFVPRGRASLPRLHRIGPEAARLLGGFPVGVAGLVRAPEQLSLPGLGAVVGGCPSWLLRLYEADGAVRLSSPP